MNKLGSAILVTLRGYHGRGGGRPRGRRLRVAKPVFTEQKLYPDANDNDEPDEDDFDDVEKDESDFMRANQTYTEYMREKYQEKEKLKMRIVGRKYFKSDDPNFLTWTEKMEIKSLHAKDPVEWSPERLSESFPALPDTIRRIIRANWQPNNAKVVIKYDEKVIDNWNKFRSGNIAVSPKLEAHLQQFKGRKIEAADLKTIAEKFVRQKPVFPEPKATLFSSLVRDYVEPPKAEEKIPRISDGKERARIDLSQVKIEGKRVNFDTFVEKTVGTLSRADNLSPELQLLVDEYKKKKDEEALGNSDTSGAEVEGMKVENTKGRGSFEAKKDGKIGMKRENIFSKGESSTGEFRKGRDGKTASLERKERETVVMVGKSPQALSNSGPKYSPDEEEVASFEDERINFEMEEEKPPESRLDLNVEGMKGVGEVKQEKVVHVDVPKLNSEQDSLATGIVEWKKKEVSGPEDYPKFIKIPKDKAQKQITFRVQDRYYDCDGEFLYRVPGLKPV
ncbi:uncharacterized protein LOC107048960 [Diachasma alloeum]|uniref:uncharacterized protein LOC107048960 n=1 Tax=Diachasma alloeum TaxID=454923 RepID=UPI0007384B93|nr:uncharacterized protein LOC107048960 [Diachasma alloeum]